MPNHKSAEKRVRQTAKRNERNTARRTEVRGYVKKVKSLIESGAFDEAGSALQLAEKEMASAASQGVFHKRTASRKTARLNAALKRAKAKASA